MSAISRILIEQQFASIGISTVHSQLHITTPHPQMTIQNVAPEMTVESVGPSFEIDWQEVYGESGLKRPAPLAKSIRDSAYADTMRSVSTISRDGEFLGDVTKPGNRVAQLSKQKNHATQTEINLSLMPRRKPQVKWDTGHVNISWSRHQLIVEWDTEFMPEFSVEPPYSVEIFLRNKPHITISIAEDEEPLYGPGQAVDINM